MKSTPREPRTAPTTSGCKRVSRPWHNSIQAVTARWNAVSRWSNRFVSLSWLILLAACHSTPREDSQAPALYIVKRGADGTVNGDAGVPRAAPGSTGAASAKAHGETTPAPSATAAAGAPANSAPVPAPVPPQAAQQYAAALKLMK